MRRLWTRLKERRLGQWGLAYLAGAWLLLQVLDLLRGTFDWPQAAQQVATVLLGVGFLAALVLAWYHGERGEQKVTTMEIGMLAGILVMAAAAASLVDGSTDAHPPAPALEASPSPGSATVAEQRSIAVLRFADMSPGQDQAYLSDGIAEEILNALAKLDGLRVAARTSSFSFEGKDMPIPDIARQLQVAHVLEGSVQRAGQRVRITAQLIEASTGYHVWSEKYDRELEDVFAVQEEIARAIVQALRVELAGDRRESLAEAGTDDVEAYSLYLQGRFFFNKYTEADLRRSIDLYEQALARDPGYARASAAIAFVWTGLADDWMAPREAYPKARTAALQALALDSALSAGHVALGAVLMLHDWDLAGAERAFRKGIELNPNDPQARTELGAVLGLLGRFDEAIVEIERARSLDPVGPYPGQRLARIYLAMRRYEAAVGEAQRLLAFNPHYLFAFRYLGDAHLATHHPADALEVYRQGLAVDDGLVRLRAGEARALAGLGRTDEARRIVARLEEEAERRYVRAEEIAQAYAALGEADEAFEWLEKAHRERSAGLIFLEQAPASDPLRSDPRFQEFVNGITKR